ncbi:hypothetical protein ACYATP_08600 [Lactobacillaceae bacterium Melli_B4]
MFNRRVYMLCSITAPQCFIAVNCIDRHIILGHMDHSWRIPAIDAQLVTNHQIRRELLTAIKQRYQLIVTARHAPFLMTAPPIIKASIDKLERRYYMSVELINH